MLPCLCFGSVVADLSLHLVCNPVVIYWLHFLLDTDKFLFPWSIYLAGWPCLLGSPIFPFACGFVFTHGFMVSVGIVKCNRWMFCKADCRSPSPPGPCMLCLPIWGRILLPFESGWARRFALTSRAWQKWPCATSGFCLERSHGFYFQPLRT